MELPLDTSIEAEYADGFTLSETEHGDISPYNANQNILRAIIDRAPEVQHGKLVRFSVFYKDQRFDVDWVGLPENARPIRFRDAQRTLDDTGSQTFSWTGCRFGYQYTGSDGKNVQEVYEL